MQELNEFLEHNRIPLSDILNHRLKKHKKEDVVQIIKIPDVYNSINQVNESFSTPKPTLHKGLVKTEHTKDLQSSFKKKVTKKTDISQIKTDLLDISDGEDVLGKTLSRPYYQDILKESIAKFENQKMEIELMKTNSKGKENTIITERIASSLIKLNKKIEL